MPCHAMRMNEDIYISSNYTYNFKVCKFVHHHKFKQINQLDATTPQVYYLTFMYSSTYFGRPHAHHQKLNNCSSSLCFYRWTVVVAVLMVVVGPAGRPDHDQQHRYHHAPAVKPVAAIAVVELLMMGVRTPETC